MHKGNYSILALYAMTDFRPQILSPLTDEPTDRFDLSGLDKPH